jgi:hypothetical protein
MLDRSCHEVVRLPEMMKNTWGTSALPAAVRHGQSIPPPSLAYTAATTWPSLLHEWGWAPPALGEGLHGGARNGHTRMAVGANIAAAKPALVGTIRLGTEVRLGVDGALAASGDEVYHHCISRFDIERTLLPMWIARLSTISCDLGVCDPKFHAVDDNGSSRVFSLAANT